MQPANTIARWTPLHKILLLALLAVAVFYIPYFIPVQPSISVSYIAGFSNKGAQVLFILCAALFAVLTRGEIAKMEEQDSSLPLSLLLPSLIFVLLVCMCRWSLHAGKEPGFEAVYFLNRQQLLTAGLVPFRQFEFAYGPLLLYPTVWLARLFRLSPASAYCMWWSAQWLLGTVMMWVLVRAIDIPVWRRSVFLCSYYFWSLAGLSLRVPTTHLFEPMQLLS